jgi:glycosyltransferase involved in cell wall biosynthesis
LRALLGRHFGTGDAYSRNLIALGHESADIIVNCDELQSRWVQERRWKGGITSLATRVPGRAGDVARQTAQRAIALAQIREFDPDVVYIQNMSFFTRRQLDRLRKAGRLGVGQIASPAPSDKIVQGFDLVLTSFPHFVDRFRGLGVASEYFAIAFDEVVLGAMRQVGVPGTPTASRPHGVVFVGGLDPRVHAAGTRMLERIAPRTDVEFWGYGADALPPDSPILSRYRGEAWAEQMYRVLGEARIAINRHIDAAEGFANNMRLFEATGMGALLVTDSGHNLAALFEPGVELVTYDDEDELVEKVDYYVNHASERVAIAEAGQRRTLADHTYQKRIEELTTILDRYR